MAKPITYVGLDVHKDTIAVALAEILIDGRQLVGELRVEMFDYLGIAQHGLPPLSRSR